MWAAEDDGRSGLLKADYCEAPACSGPLQEYSAEFARLRTVAQTKLQALRETTHGRDGAWAEDARAAERALEVMESNRRQVQVQLRLELTGTDANARKEWDQRLQEWSREVAALRGQLEEAREAHSRQALGLHSGSGVEARAFTAEHRSAMKSTEMLERSSQKLEEAKRAALESEEVGSGVLSDLSGQRETILHMRDNMRTVDTELSSARQAIGRLFATAQRNRLVTIVIATVLGIGLSFWGLCFLGLPLKWTLVLAFAVVVLVGAICFVRRRLKARLDVSASNF